eukprot:m.74839 g.74839  ORF g.74839 m.74839 type:complete len:365 (+) comp13111_c0_seq2:342-1436(+)
MKVRVVVLVCLLVCGAHAGLFSSSEEECDNEHHVNRSMFDEDPDKAYELHNAAEEGLHMPIIGIGTGGYPNGDKWDDSVAEKAVLAFLKAGGRRIDTSLGYGTQKGIGRAIKKSGIPREEIFITTKVDSPTYGLVAIGYKEALKSVDLTLSDLDTDYIDLVLVHFPGDTFIEVEVTSSTKKPSCFKKPDNWQKCRKETWQALEKVFNDGKARAIGVANFMVPHLQELVDLGGMLPAVNQIEFHPYWHLEDVLDFCSEHDILVNGYAPLGAPDRMIKLRKEMPVILPENEVVKRIAKKAKMSPAQVLLRWSVQRGVVINPRTKDEKHMKELLAVLDLKLSKAQMAELYDIDDPPMNVCGDCRWTK